jgi:hypothetical protein
MKTAKHRHNQADIVTVKYVKGLYADYLELATGNTIGILIEALVCNQIVTGWPENLTVLGAMNPDIYRG